jgi:(p)ppGpp synthase/HD superfamily hydrolase
MNSDCQERLHRATAFVLHHHADQTRKGSSIPYVSHLLQVSGAVLEYGGSTDQAIAALCHDAIEDCDVTREQLQAEFGPAVAQIVADCTDTLPGDSPTKKSDWKTRKTRYLAHLAEADGDSVLVAACDKLHNLSCIVSDVRAVGTGYLDRFSAAPDQQLWYFSSFLANTRDRLPKRLILAFESQLETFRTQIGAS